MEQRQPGGEPAPEFRLSQETARRVADRTGAPRERRTFLSTDHLSTEAAAAYVDGRLPQAGQIRADAHLELCGQCRREIDDQREARRALRGSGPIRMPSDLRDRLRDLESLGPRENIARAGPETNDHRGAETADEHGADSPWSRLLRRLRRPGH